MKIILKNLIIALSCCMLFSCEQDAVPENKFIGSWKIETPDNDTIVFSNETRFTRNYSGRIHHYFDYHYDNDSITVQYRGPNKIYAYPRIHHYEFKQNELIIDFRNGSYGFEREIYKLIRIK